METKEVIIKRQKVHPMRAMSRPDTTGRPLPAHLSKDDPDLAFVGTKRCLWATIFAPFGMRATKNGGWADG